MATTPIHDAAALVAHGLVGLGIVPHHAALWATVRGGYMFDRTAVKGVADGERSQHGAQGIDVLAGGALAAMGFPVFPRDACLSIHKLKIPLHASGHTHLTGAHRLTKTLAPFGWTGPDDLVHCAQNLATRWPALLWTWPDPTQAHKRYGS